MMGNMMRHYMFIKTIMEGKVLERETRRKENVRSIT